MDDNEFTAYWLDRLNSELSTAEERTTKAKKQLKQQRLQEVWRSRRLIFIGCAAEQVDDQPLSQLPMGVGTIVAGFVVDDSPQLPQLKCLLQLGD